MKHNIYILLLVITIGFTQCCKEKPNNSNNNNIPGLPPVTQTGTNTLGFLLNGVPWVPEGPNNLSMDYDPGFNDGILGIVAYRRISINNSTQFLIGIRDSLNHIDFSEEIKIGRGQLGYMSFSNTNFCLFTCSISNSRFAEIGL